MQSEGRGTAARNRRSAQRATGVISTRNRRRAVPKEREQLELEAFRAVSGGDYVRSRLLHGFALGNPSVESTAYVVKSRVKRVDSLILKVLDRREKKETPNYRPADARDIVGFRLMTLFRNELPLLVRRFMDFVESSQHDRLDLFAGKTIKDAVLEIRIYLSSQRRDPNMDLCIRELMDFGFPQAKLGATKSRRKSTVEIEVDTRGSQYSSIHIVLLAKGPAGQDDGVPVEVQLRTSLEDVWGEIDHRIVYKDKHAGATKEEERQREVERASIGERVQSLKQALDACSAIADTIETDISRPAPISLASEYRTEVTTGIDRLRDLPVSNAISSRLARATQTLVSFSSEITALPLSTASPDAGSLLTRLGTATLELEGAHQDYLAQRPRRSRSDRNIRFRIGMEIALCYYWQAILLRDGPVPQIRGVIDTWRNAIRRSIGEFVKLAVQPEFRENPALAYRLANAISFQGNEDYALANLRLACQLLARDTELEPTHYLRIRIPRQYGVSLWQSGSRLEEKSIELGDRTFSWRAEREIYLQALDVTLPVYGREVVGGDLDRRTMTTAGERVITANNVVFYATCFLDCGGTWEELEGHSVTRKRFRELVKEVIPKGGISSINRITFASTLRLAAKYLEDEKLKKRAARRVVALHGTKSLSVPLSDYSYKKVLLDALRDLDKA